MQHTTNYNLNQWDADDRVKREDFNADNAKIDAALAGLAPVVAKIWETTVSADTMQVDIPTAALSPADYFLLAIIIDCPITANNGDTRLLLDLQEWCYPSRVGGNAAYALGGSYNGGIMLLRQRQSGTRGYFHCFSEYLNGSGERVSTHYFYEGFFADITTLNLLAAYDTYPIHAGTKIAVYGLKK